MSMGRAVGRGISLLLPMMAPHGFLNMPMVAGLAGIGVLQLTSGNNKEVFSLSPVGDACRVCGADRRVG